MAFPLTMRQSSDIIKRNLTGGESDMNSIVSEWYEEKKNVDEMRNWNPALKEWERSVISFFPPGARILAAVWDEKHLHYPIWDIM